MHLKITRKLSHHNTDLRLVFVSFFLTIRYIEGCVCLLRPERVQRGQGKVLGRGQSIDLRLWQLLYLFWNFVIIAIRERERERDEWLKLEQHILHESIFSLALVQV